MKREVVEDLALLALIVALALIGARCLSRQPRTGVVMPGGAVVRTTAL